MSSRDQDNVVAKAIAALEESVASIVGCDDDDATKRNALAETFTQFQTYLDRNGGGDSRLVWLRASTDQAATSRG
jgi:hypothetical protein